MLFKLNKRSKLSILFWKSIVPANSAAIQFNNSAFYHPLKCHPKKSHFWQQKSKKKFIVNHQELNGIDGQKQV